MEMRMLKTKLITVEEMELIQELNTYVLLEGACNYYKQYTRGNDFATLDEVKRKLIRNIVLSYEAPTKEGLEHKRTFYYGCLIIQINTTEGSICYIQNKLDDKHTYKIDMEKRSALNYIMGIEEGK